MEVFGVFLEVFGGFWRSLEVFGLGFPLSRKSRTLRGSKNSPEKWRFLKPLLGRLKGTPALNRTHVLRGTYYFEKP